MPMKIPNFSSLQASQSSDHPARLEPSEASFDERSRSVARPPGVAVTVAPSRPLTFTRYGRVRPTGFRYIAGETPEIVVTG